MKLAGAVFFQRQRQSGDRAGHADAERGIARLVAVGLAVGAEKDIARDRSRRGLAIIDGDVFVALGRMNHHEAAAADIAGARIGDGQRKAGGDRGVDRIAALPQDVGADLRGDLFLRHHHAVLGRNGANGGEIGAARRARRSCATAGAAQANASDERGNCPAPPD